jgi:hypothetical protein
MVGCIALAFSGIFACIWLSHGMDGNGDYLVEIGGDDFKTIEMSMRKTP